MRIFNIFKDAMKKADTVVEHPGIRLPKGTIITCPACAKTIGTSNRDIVFGESIRSDAWDSDIIVKNGPLRCPDDNVMYIKQGADKKLLHTSEGWI